MRTVSRSSAALAAMIAVFVAATPAAAQETAAPETAEQSAGGVGDIIVTAQRREQKLQDVGVSIVAATGDMLRAANVMDSKDIARIAPGVVFDSTNGGTLAANLTVRGVSQSDFSAHQESPNSIYIDDVYIAMSAEAAFNIYDLDRVEVLRGPQGTLFGKASSGGLASFVTKRPTDEFDGYLELGVGKFNQLYAEGAVGGPISDTVRFRLSGRAERADGWFKNKMADGEDSMESRFYGIRGQIEADLTENLTARVLLNYDVNPKHVEGTYKPENFYIVNGEPLPLPANVDAYGTGPGNDFNGYRDPYEDNQTGSFNNGGFVKKQRYAPTLYLTWNGDDFTINSVTNYTRFKLNWFEDSDGTPLEAAIYDESMRLHQFSQELRINGSAGALTYTAGAYYLNTKMKIGGIYYFPFFNYVVSNPVHQDTESIGLFGQLEYEFSPKLTGTFGVRWTHEKKDFRSTAILSDDPNAPPYYDFNSQTAPDFTPVTSNLWTGKAQLNYKPIDDMLIYASVSRGAKGPGFNANLGGSISFAETPYKDETLWAYEIGAKNTLFDGKAIFNVSGFYYDYSDFQGFAFAGLGAKVANYSATFYGAEAQLTAKLPAQIDVSLGGSYLHSKIRDVTSVYFGVRDQQGVNAPKWTANGNITKTFTIGDNDLSFNWSFDYLDDRYASIDNNRATFIKGSFLHNARVAYKLHNEGLEISAFVNNISNIDRQNFVFDFIASNGSLLKSYARPRWYGMSVRKEF